ncbi:DUF2255 family protein [Streptomyces sp. SID13666]|nr:DUF2255 family protein [Streptomyces sp. SID13666]NEA69319.1 DUF2255 family protein [Streptomyces sp. SID13588]
MADWDGSDLKRAGAAEELDLSSRRADGSLRAPVTMWVVRAGDHLYVRSVKGTAGPWYRGVQSRRQGRIQVGGVERGVAFGVAPARASIDELMPHILDGSIHPGRVFDRTLPLEDIAEGYQAMNDRTSLKVAIRP